MATTFTKADWDKLVAEVGENEALAVVDAAYPSAAPQVLRWMAAPVALASGVRSGIGAVKAGAAALASGVRSGIGAVKAGAAGVRALPSAVAGTGMRDLAALQIGVEAGNRRELIEQALGNRLLDHELLTDMAGAKERAKAVVGAAEKARDAAEAAAKAAKSRLDDAAKAMEKAGKAYFQSKAGPRMFISPVPDETGAVRSVRVYLKKGQWMVQWGDEVQKIPKEKAVEHFLNAAKAKPALMAKVPEAGTLLKARTDYASAAKKAASVSGTAKTVAAEAASNLEEAADLNRYVANRGKQLRAQVLGRAKSQAALRASGKAAPAAATTAKAAGKSGGLTSAMKWGGKVLGAAGAVDSVTGAIGHTYRGVTGAAEMVEDDFKTHTQIKAELADLDKARKALRKMPAGPEKTQAVAEYQARGEALQPYMEILDKMAGGGVALPGAKPTAKGGGRKSLFSALGDRLHNWYENFDFGIGQVLDDFVGRETDFGVSPTTGRIYRGSDFKSRAAKAASVGAASNAKMAAQAGALPGSQEEIEKMLAEAGGADGAGGAGEGEPEQEPAVPAMPSMSRQQALRMTKDALDASLAAHGMSEGTFKLYAMRSRLGNALSGPERKAVASKMQSIMGTASKMRDEMMAPYFAQIETATAPARALVMAAEKGGGGMDEATYRKLAQGEAAQLAFPTVRDALRAEAEAKAGGAMFKNELGMASVPDADSGGVKAALPSGMIDAASAKLAAAQRRAENDPAYSPIFASAMEKLKASKNVQEQLSIAAAL